MKESTAQPIKTIRTGTSVVEIYPDHIIKTLLHDTDKERLWAEANALKLLGNSDVSPKLIEQGIRDGQEFIKMERIEGASLHEAHLSSSQNIDGVAFSVIHNLATIHENDILHRDFKPANLILEKLGNVRVIDFGCSSGIEISPKEPKRFIYTTPCAIPPEIHLGKSRWTKVGEVFSLGVVLYHLYTGKYPFGNGKTDEIAERACFDRPKPIDNPMWPIIHNCLVKDPSVRYQSANEVLGDMLAMQGGQVIPYRDPPKVNLVRSVASALLYLPGNALLAAIVLIAFFGMYSAGYFGGGSEVLRKIAFFERLEKRDLVPIKVVHSGDFRVTRLMNSGGTYTFEKDEVIEIPYGSYIALFKNPNTNLFEYESVRIIPRIGSDLLKEFVDKEDQLKMASSVLSCNCQRDKNGAIEFVKLEGFPQSRNKRKIPFPILRGGGQEEKKPTVYEYCFVVDYLEGTPYRLPTFSELTEFGISNPAEFLCIENSNLGIEKKVVVVPKDGKLLDKINIPLLYNID